MIEGKVYGNLVLLFTNLDNDQTKEKEENQIAVSSDAAKPYKD